MKKQVILFLSAGVLFFSACNNQPANNGASQAQIDSMVDAKVDKVKQDLAAQNDSLINAKAQEKAAEMTTAAPATQAAPAAAPARHSSSTKTTKTTTTTTTSSSNTNTNNQTPPDSKITKDQQQQQQQKFNNR